jgi:hypothetical protein
MCEPGIVNLRNTIAGKKKDLAAMLGGEPPKPSICGARLYVSPSRLRPP